MQQTIAKRLLTSTASVALVAMLASGGSAQSPQAPTVAAGSIAVTRQGQTTVVTQGTDKGIIDWRSFSIGPQEAVRFDQPGRSSVTLNRVTGAEQSRIDGNLSATGQVWLANPNGVMIGPGGQVNVGGLLATTGRIDAQEFLRSGKALIDQIPKDATILNSGSITAGAGGYAALAAAAVENKGVIAARSGTVAMGSGKAMTLDFAGDKLITYQVTQPLDQKPDGADALVTNSGEISAPGGAVLLSARAAKGVIDNVINLKGKVIANSIRVDGGAVILGDGGATQISGTLDVSDPAGVGGKVEITAPEVIVAPSAVINASGATGGGSVKVKAATIEVKPAAQISARATESGNGGRVSLRADKTLNVAAPVSVQGGASSGDGGAIEAASSGATLLTGKLTADASNGKGGTVVVAGGMTIQLAGAQISAIGLNGGGTVAVGAYVSDLGYVVTAPQLLDMIGGVIDVSAGAPTQIARIQDDGSMINVALPGARGGAVAVEGTRVSIGGGGVIKADGDQGGAIRVRVKDSYISSLGARLQADATNGAGGQVEIAGRGDAPDGRATDGRATATILNSGSISARSQNAKGGSVALLGEKTGVLDGSDVNASGGAGGGTVLIGGDWQGKGLTPRAQASYVAPNARINVDATQKGDGGKAVVWADDSTRFQGTISARGGLLGGDGGQVETSGKRALDVAGTAIVDASARSGAGKVGAWLLDPSDITIQDPGPFSGISGGIFDPLGSSTIDPNYIAAQLAFSSVTLQTSGGSGGLGDITFASGTIAYAGLTPSALTLKADRDIIFQSGTAITSSSAALNVTLNSGANAAMTTQSAVSGGIHLHGGTISTNGGTIQMVGGASGSLNAQGSGATARGVDINAMTLDVGTFAGGGAIVIKGQGRPGDTSANVEGVYIDSSTLSAYNGITIIGVGGDAATSVATGVSILGGVMTGTGNPGGSGRIDITGTGGAGAATSQNGVTFSAAASISFLNGGVNVIGVGGGPGGDNKGIRITNGTNLDGSGPIFLTGSGGGSAGTTGDIGVYVVNPGGIIRSTTDFITISGTRGFGGGSANVAIDLSTLSTTNGDINIHGDSTVNGYGSSNHGIRIDDSTLSTSNGAIFLSGSGALGGTGNQGVAIGVPNFGPTAIASGGSGGVTIIGVGNGGPGINIVGSASVTTTIGNIFLQGAATAAAGIAIDQQINAGSGALILQADSLSLTGAANSIAGTGPLNILPYLASTTIGVGDGATGDLQLDSAALAPLATTFSSLTVGRPDGTGNINVGTISRAGSMTVLSGGGAGDVVVSGSVTLTGASSNFTAVAGRNVNVSGVIDLSGASGGAISLLSDSARVGNGSVVVTNAMLQSGGGDIVLSGGLNPLTDYASTNSGLGVQIGFATLNSGAGSIIVRGKNLSSDAGGVYVQSATLTGASILIDGVVAANATLNGAINGVRMDGVSVIATGANGITITGMGGGTVTNNEGVILLGGSLLRSTNGNIAITGTGGGGSSSEGVSIGDGASGATVETIGAGSILISGTATGSGGQNRGVGIDSGSIVRATSGGAIDIIGQRGGGDGSENVLITGSGVQVSALTGSLSITGNYAGGSGSTGGNHGVAISSNAVVKTTDGAISITGVGGPGGSGNQGIALSPDGSGGTVMATGLGSIVLIGTAGAGGVGIFASSGTASTDSGRLDFVADSLSATASNFSSTSGVVAIRPFTKSRSIGVGGGAGALQIDSAFIGSVSGALEIGDPTGSGDLDVGAVSRSGSFIAQSGADVSVSGQVNLAGAASVFKAIAGLNVSVTSTGGVTTAGGAITLNSDADAVGGGAIQLASGSSLASNGGNITLGGGANPLVGYAMGVGASVEGIKSDGAVIDSGAGTISMRGMGSQTLDGQPYKMGVFINGGTLTSTGGIVIDGVGGNSTASESHGVGIGGARLTAGGMASISITGQRGGDPDAYNVSIGSFSTIETTGGNLTVAGASTTGGGAPTVLGNAGIGFGDALLTTSTGAILIDGAGGSLGGGNHGILTSPGSPVTIQATGSGGSILLRGAAGAGGVGISATALNASTLDGALTLETDSLSSVSLGLSSTSGVITIQPMTPGTSIGVGAGVGALQISNSALAGISGPTIIGRGNGSGAIDANGFVSPNQLTLRTPSGTATLANGTVAAGGLDVQAAAIILSGVNSTTGAQSYQGPVTLAGAATLSTGNGDVAFASAVDGANSLTVAAGTGQLTFGGAVGGATALASLASIGSGRVNVAGGSVSTGGSQSYAGDVLLTSHAVFSTANNDVIFSGAVDSVVPGGYALTTSLGTGVASFAAGAGAGTALASLSVGTAVINGNVNTAGQQSYGDTTILGASTFSAINAAINFTGTLDGPGALTLATGTGAITQPTQTGSLVPLASFIQNGTPFATSSSTAPTTPSVPTTASTPSTPSTPSTASVASTATTPSTPTTVSVATIATSPTSVSIASVPTVATIASTPTFVVVAPTPNFVDQPTPQTQLELVLLQIIGPSGGGSNIITQILQPAVNFNTGSSASNTLFTTTALTDATGSKSASGTGDSSDDPNAPSSSAPGARGRTGPGGGPSGGPGGGSGPSGPPGSGPVSASNAAAVVARTPSGMLIPPTPTSLSNTGAPLAATRTVKVDPLDAGGGGGQTVTPIAPSSGSAGASLARGLVRTSGPARAAPAPEPPLAQQPSNMNEEQLIP